MAPVRMPNARVEAIDNNDDGQFVECLWGEMLGSGDTLENLLAGGSTNYGGYFASTFGDFVAANEAPPQTPAADVIEEPPLYEFDVGVDIDIDIPRGFLKDLTLDLVSETFTIAEKHAANILGVGVSTLKTWCRFNGIPRWPFRKIRRIENLQDNIKRFGSDEMFEDRIAGTVQKLEVEKMAIINNPSRALESNTIDLSKNMNHVASRKRKRN